MKINFGIREKLLAPLILGLVIIISILFVFWQPSQLVEAKKEFIKQQANILTTLSPSLVQNILSNDLAALHTILEHSLKIHKNKWRYIQLNDSDNKQLYPIFSAKPKKTKTLLEIKVTIEEDDEIFGVLHLYTDWKEIKEKETKLNNLLALSSILLLIIISSISYYAQTLWIYNPITKLKDLTSQISRGNYKIKLPRTTHDEIGLLAESIDRMRNKIQLSMIELVDKEEMQRAILETAPDAIITMNKQGVIQSFNPGAEKIFQYSKDEAVGKNIKTLMPDDIASHHDKYVNNYNSTDSIIIGKHRELYGIKKDGTFFPIELTINSSQINNELLFTGVLRDITERKKVDRLKDEFTSTVSHELRTPLTAIKGSLDLVMKGFNLDLPEQANTMLEVAERNVERLLILINDILDISKLESGEINFVFENIEVAPFIQECIELNQEYAKKYNTIFVCKQCHDDITINVDKDRLTQVMSNLLSNAAKYSPENVAVEIFTHVNNDTLRISVKDHGTGIPEEFQPLLFNKFTQSSSGDTRQVGGTGLGLSITKTIIERMGGTIDFETIPGKETTFYFELPTVS